MQPEINVNNVPNTNALDNVQPENNVGAVEHEQVHNVPGNINPNSVLTEALPHLEEPNCEGGVAQDNSEQLGEALQEARNESTSYTQKSIALAQALETKEKANVQQAFDALMLEEGPFTQDIAKLVDEARQFLGLPEREIVVELDDESHEAVNNLLNKAPENVEKRPVEEIKAEIDRLSNALAQPAEGAREDEHGIGALVDVAKSVKLVQDIDEVQSQAKAGEIIKTYTDLIEDNETSVEDKLEKLGEMTVEVNKLQQRKAALSTLNNPQATEIERTAAEGILSNTAQLALTASDIDRVTAEFENCCAKLIATKLLAAEAQHVTEPVKAGLHALAKVVSQKGTSLVALCNALECGFATYGAALPKAKDPNKPLPAFRADLIQVLGNYINEDPALPANMRVDLKNVDDRVGVMKVVNLMFQGGMPERANEALALKMALLPGHEEEVREEQAMMLAHRNLMNTLFEGNKKANLDNSYLLKNFAAIKMTVGSNSMRSILLTPETVKEIVKYAHGINIGKSFKSIKTKDADGNDKVATEIRHHAKDDKGSIRDVNYQIANLIVLQYKAVNGGLLKVDEGVADNFKNLDNWIRALKLDNEMVQLVVDRAQKLEGKNGEPSPDLVMLSGAQIYKKGLSGEVAAQEAFKTTKNSTEAIGGKRDAKNLATSAPGWDEFVIFNRAVADLTGLTKEKDRLKVAPNGGMIINDEANGKIKTIVEDILNKISNKSKDGKGEYEELARVKAGFRSASGKFKDNISLLQNVGDMKEDHLSLKKSNASLEDRLAKMEAAKKSIKWAWIDKNRAARVEASKNVLNFCKIKGQLDNANLSADEREKLESDLNAARESLKGVSAKKMRPGNHRDITPSDDVILGEMRRRAEAVMYFTPADGAEKSQAQLDAEKIKADAKTIKNLAADISKLDKKVEKFIGKADSKQIERAVVAAMLKVALESQGVPRKVSLRNPEVSKQLFAQLSTWGFPYALDPADSSKYVSSEPAIDALVHSIMNRYMLSDGMLNVAELTAFRKASRTRATSSSNNSFISSAVRNSEMAKRIMDMASQPGMSFVYSKSRGVNLNTGAFFTPWSRAEVQTGSLNIKGVPATFQVKALGENDFSVCNLGGNRWQVIVKDGANARFGGSLSVLGFDLKVAKIGVSASGGVGRSGAAGVVLNFANNEDCENFIKALIGNSEKETNEAFKKAFVGASQVRFVDKKGFALDASVGAAFSSDLLAHQFNEFAKANLGANASLGDKFNTVSTTEQNDRGMTLVSRVENNFSASAGIQVGYNLNPGEKVGELIKDKTGLDISVGIKADPTAIIKNGIDSIKNPSHAGSDFVNTVRDVTSSKMSASVNHSYAFERKIVIGESGISAETGITKSIKLKAGFAFMKNGAAHNFFSGEFRDALKNAPKEFMEELNKIFDSVGPNDTVSLESKITEEARKKIQALSIEARSAKANANPVRVLECQEQIANILSNNKSYSPTKIVVKGASTRNLTNLTGIGLGPVQWVRTNNLTVAATKGTLEIKLSEWLKKAAEKKAK